MSVTRWERMRGTYVVVYVLPHLAPDKGKRVRLHVGYVCSYNTSNIALNVVSLTKLGNRP